MSCGRSNNTCNTTPGRLCRARQHLEAAIRADPSYARPYGLAVHGWRIYDWFWEMSDDGSRDVLQLARRRSRWMIGMPRPTWRFGRVPVSWQHHRALHHIERAMALNPNDDLIATSMPGCWSALAGGGWIVVHPKAMRLNPYHPNWYWNIEGFCLHTAGRYQEAIDAYGRIEVPQFSVEALPRCVSRHVRQERAPRTTAPIARHTC